jgi:hypothetical protein
VSMHRLVQEVARGRLVERGAEAEAVARAVGLVPTRFHSTATTCTTGAPMRGSCRMRLPS